MSGSGWFRSASYGSQRATAAAILVWVLSTVGWTVLLNRDMTPAWQLPDVNFYLLMAGGHMDRVPRPFSARPLHPFLARMLAQGTGTSLHTGFTVLAVASLTWTAAILFFLLVRRGVPRWLLLLVASVPFWPAMLSFAGVPDPFYSAFIATLLLCLECEWWWAAALLLFPMMLARESTSLTLLCLLLVAGRRMGWVRSLAGVGCVLAAAAVVRHLSRNSLPNPENLGGGLYMTGKLISNSFRSVGFVPWSNVYPALCSVPAWQTGVHLGRVRSIGLCRWSPLALVQLIWAVVTTFGVLPALLVAGRGRWRRLWGEAGPMLRFCLLYGGVSFLLGPALGTWYVRLMGYGWPLFLVAVPLVAAQSPGLQAASAHGRPWLPGVVVMLHLVISAFGAANAFALLNWIIVLQAAALALVAGATAAQARRATAEGFPGGA